MMHPYRCRYRTLLVEAEVQPLVALVCRLGQIFQPLLFTESLPHLVLLLVPPHVVAFDPEIEENVQAANPQAHFVSALVVRRVIWNTAR